MEWYVNEIEDVLEYAKAVKAAGAHGITWVNHEGTIQDKDKFRVCLSTSLGYVHWSRSTKDEDEIRDIQAVLDNIDDLFKRQDVSRIHHDKEKNAWFIGFSLSE